MDDGKEYKIQDLTLVQLNFFLVFYFEIITDSWEVVKKYTGRSLEPFPQPPPLLASSITVAHYQNQEIGIGTSHQAYSYFISYIYTNLHVCVCVHFYYMCSL